ncbi:CBS domain-containing protein [Mesorhizobium sp. WSM4303]|uniref:CBS domain-containing protein n=1 Tax=unclassified Mesorhizobium TaxID=325217 RepID=UPI00115D722F|nr:MULTISPECIES: CBS domain-containing protein [unclassified Mesorhizobium]TRC99652.1 CBS domain-containing protein [Mesorhizobium sp. WSM4306]TRD03260.1 CBS domain-containing protein [Mesorhizobium sp. WSM4303]
MQAEAIMSKPVIAIDPSASIAEAAGLMLTNKISGLPVIRSDGALVGIVSEGDFLRRRELGTQRKRPRWLEFLVSSGKAAEEYVQANARRIDEVMSDSVVTVSPTTSLAAVVNLMTRHNFKRIPVVAEGKVVGIVTRSDLVRALVGVLSNTSSTPASDDEIRDKIVAELSAKKWARADMVGVAVENGAVELSGVIFDERERQAAIVAAENVPGVRSVKDNLFCTGPLSAILVS